MENGKCVFENWKFKQMIKNFGELVVFSPNILNR